MNETELLQVFFSVRKSSLLSKFFAWLQDGIGHTGLGFELPQIDKPWIWEAKGHGGLSYSDPQEFNKNVTLIEVYGIKWTTEERLIALKRMDELLREHYGFFGVIGMTFVLVAKKVGGWTDNPFPWGFFCSQAVYKVLKDVFGLYIDSDPSENRVGPVDIRDMFRELVKKYPDKIVRLL